MCRRKLLGLGLQLPIQQELVKIFAMLSSDNTPERLAFIFKGDTNAVQLVLDVAKMSHIWDDMIDKDKPVSDEQINWAFWAAMVGIPSNPFYQAYRHELIPIFDLGIFNYIAANELEKGDQMSREAAHAARYQIGDVAITIARIIGGREWAMKYAPEIKRKANIENPLSDYLTELEEKYGRPN